MVAVVAASACAALLMALGPAPGGAQPAAAGAGDAVVAVVPRLHAVVTPAADLRQDSPQSTHGALPFAGLAAAVVLAALRRRHSLLVVAVTRHDPLFSANPSRRRGPPARAGRS